MIQRTLHPSTGRKLAGRRGAAPNTVVMATLRLFTHQYIAGMARCRDVGGGDGLGAVTRGKISNFRAH